MHVMVCVPLDVQTHVAWPPVCLVLRRGCNDRLACALDIKSRCAYHFVQAHIWVWLSAWVLRAALRTYDGY